MKNKLFLLMAMFVLFAASPLVAQSTTPTDIIVTNSGDVLNVYHLDYSPANYCYYTLTAEDDAAVSRIAKSEIMIIKLSDGTKVDPNATAATPVATTTTSEKVIAPLCIESYRAIGKTTKSQLTML